MHKQITSILLVAGTCIGGGTIAIPMVLAKLGIMPSIIITILMWLLNYYPSLVGAELNLRSEQGLSLGELGKNFFGKGAQIIGEISVKVLSYAALTMYLCGASSIIQKLVEEYFRCEVSIIIIETCIAITGMILLLYPLKIISAVNNLIFSGLIIVFLTLLGIMMGFTDYTNMPWIVNPTPRDVLSVCPVIFASFGYQLILHTLRDYCEKDAKILKRSIFIGSSIPALIYIVWSITSLSAVFRANPDFFALTVAGKIGVGEFVKELANISSFSHFQVMVWWMSIFAILTSFIGVSIGLAGSLNLTLKKRIKVVAMRKLSASIITVMSAYIIAAIIPNAFIKILGFTGAMVVVIGILLPVYLLFKNGIEKLHYSELKKFPLVLCVIAGIIVMGIEIFINN